MFTDAEKSKAAARECALRRNVYKRRVESGAMSQADADREISIMAEIAGEYGAGPTTAMRNLRRTLWLVVRMCSKAGPIKVDLDTIAEFPGDERAAVAMVGNPEDQTFTIEAGTMVMVGEGEPHAG